ncbi:MAG: hypothetical protein RO009_11470 [Pseudorhodoplanes sp.]|nr:hypothetical protein [Pseudorhodoplanes sp.]
MQEDRMPSTKRRVPKQTAKSVNARIQRTTEQRIRHFDQNQDQIDRRLRELEREWDVERALESNAAIAGLIALAIAGQSQNRRWLALPAVISGFLLQHAIQGWCPPLPVFRQLGFRTSYEIEQERQALKALRGDFARLPSGRGRGRVRASLRAARA